MDGPRKRTGPVIPAPPQQVPPPSSTDAILPNQGDPRRIGELLGDWLAIQMDRVDALVDEGESKVAAIPDQRHLWLLLGETLVRLHCVELEVAELKRGRR
jgi:hypothetical protein